MTLLLPSVASGLDTIVQADWLALVNAVPSQSVNLCLTDMPYGTTACTWDTVIDLAAWWREIKRVMTPNGAVVMTASQPFTTDLINSNRAWFKYELIWSKSFGTGFLDVSLKPLKQHEGICIFYEHQPTYTPQMRKGPMHRRNSPGPSPLYGNHASRELTHSTEYYPTSILQFASENGIHPTQKPVALFEYLINTYTHPGDVVLDPFCGSGTTAVACANTGRRYICGDNGVDERTGLPWAEIARRRVSLDFGVTIPARQTADLGPLFAYPLPKYEP